MISVCPNCKNGDYVKYENKFKCDECETIFDNPIHMPKSEVTLPNTSFMVFIEEDVLILDGLSFGILTKLDKILSSRGNGVHINGNAFKARLHTFMTTGSEYSKCRLLKIGEDFTKYESDFENLLDLIHSKSELLLTEEIFGSFLRASVYLTREDVFDLEELTYEIKNKLATENSIDGEIEELLVMFKTINEYLEQLR